MNFFQSKNAVIVSFMRFAGGKFLMNCLALSRHACPMEPSAAAYLLKHPDDYDYRLQTVLKSLPPKNQMQKWLDFEFGDGATYGRAQKSWNEGQEGVLNDLTKKLCCSNMKFFLTDHSMEPLNLCQVWKQATVIMLINSRRFQAIAALKKNQRDWRPEHIRRGGLAAELLGLNGNYCEEKFDVLRGPDWPTWQEFEKTGYDAKSLHHIDPKVRAEIGDFYRRHLVQNQVLLFDVETYFASDKFVNAIKELYQNLNFTDFQEDLVRFFHKKYLDLHL